MKDPKKTGGGKTAPGPAGAKPGPGRGQGGAGKADPRRTPAPIAPPSVSAGALNALAAVRESATTEPKRAEKPAPAGAKPAHAPEPKAGSANARTASPPEKAPAAIAQRTARPAADRVSAPPETMKPAAASGRPKPPSGKPAPASPPSKPTDAAPADASAGSAPPRPTDPRPPLPSSPSSPPALRVVETAKPAPASVPPPAAAQPAAEPSGPPAGWGDPAGWAELNTKMLNLMRSQTEANLAIWRSTMGAGSLSEAIRMQTTGVREAYEATAAQWRDIAETAARLMGRSGASMKLPWTTDQDR